VFLDKSNLPAWYGDGYCIRSTFCSFQACGNGPCVACKDLSKQSRHHLNRAAGRAEGRIQAAEGGQTAFRGKPASDGISTAEASARIGALQHNVQALRQGNQALQDKLQRANTRIAVLHQHMAAAVDSLDKPRLVQLLEQAFKDGEPPSAVFYARVAFVCL
jgi:hypothetical protein